MSANPNPNPNPNPLPGGEGVGSGELGRAEAKEATEPSDDWSWPTLMRRSHRALSTPRTVALPSASERSSGMGTEVAPGVATVRCPYRPPKAGTQYVLYVGPWGQAAVRLRYVRNAGGWYA